MKHLNVETQGSRSNTSLITDNTVMQLAELAKIDINGFELNKTKNELCKVIEYMNVLNEMNFDENEAVSDVFGMTNVMREDTVITPFAREDILQNAPVRTLENAVVPKTVE